MFNNPNLSHKRWRGTIGNKDIVGLSDGYRESEQSWFELLLDLKRRGPQSLFLNAFLHLAAQAAEALVKVVSQDVV